MSKECGPNKILNPKTNRCVDINGKIGREILSKGKTTLCKTDEIYNPVSKRCVKRSGKIGQKLIKEEAEKEKVKSKSPINVEVPFIKPKSINRLEQLHKEQMEAMRNRDIKRIREINQEIEEEKKKIKEKINNNIPKFLETCKDSETNQLPKLPTIDGEFEMTDIIKDEKQLIIIDGLCYDIKSLFELISADISQGNVWGINPYVKREGFILPFDKTVKDTLLSTAIKRKILPRTAKWEKRGPIDADKKEMRGTYTIETKTTPIAWLKKGWASDGSAFPTKKYFAISFNFPYKKVNQSPGRTAIFPSTSDAEIFILTKLVPVWEAGCLWSIKNSVTLGIEVLNPNIHMVFEDNQPNRWYNNKMKNLEEEILKFAPAFI